MAQPYNYQVQIADPFQSALKGYETGLAMRAAEQKRALQQAEMERQQLIQQRTQAVLGNPNATADDYQSLAMLLPKDQAEVTLKVWESKSKEQKENLLSFGGQVFSALRANQPDIAKNLLSERAEAERNAGNEAQAKSYETWFELVDKSPDFAQASIGTFIAGVPGGKEMVESVININKEQEEAKQRPLKTREMNATAIIKEAEAKFAPDKFGLEIKLTESQIAQANAARKASDAAAKKSGAEAARAQAEANQMAAGVIPADKRPEAERQFRKEYSDQTKGYQDVKAAYQRVLASQPDAAGDIALIFNYMKMLDPGSVVREGEFATAQNAGGIPDRVWNIYNKLLSGERLSQSQRSMFSKQAEKLYDSAASQEKVVRDGIGRIAKGYGLNADNIFYTPTEVPPTPAPGAPKATPAAPNIQSLVEKYRTR